MTEAAHRSVRGFLVGALPALVASLGFGLLAPLPNFPDQDNYLPIARAIAAGHGWLGEDGQPQVYRPPLFSLLLGSWFALTGGEGSRSVAVFQAVMLGVAGGLTALLAGSAGAGLRGRVGAAVLFGLHPFVFTNVVFVMQEMTLAAIITAASLASLGLLKHTKPGHAALSGVLWGLTILGKITTAFAPGILGLFVLRKVGLERRRRVILAFVLLSMTACAVGAWTLRNAIVFRRFVLVNEQGVGVLEWVVAGGNPESPGSSRWNPEGAAFVRESRARIEHRPDLGVTGRKIARTRELLGYLLRHPAFTAGHVLQNALRFTGLERAWFRDNGLWPGERYGPVYVSLYLLLQAPLFLGALVTAMLDRRGSGEGLRFLVSVVVVYWAMHALVWGQPRYALPIYPILAVLASRAPSLVRTLREQGGVAGRGGAAP